MAKKKILFVITQGQWGGAQRYVYDLAVNLAKDFDIAVAVGEPNGPKDLQTKLDESGISTIQLSHLVRPISPWHDILAIFEMAKLYRNQRADIIHLNSSKAGILGSLAKFISEISGIAASPSAPRNDGPKIVYTVHGWVFEEPLGRIRKKIYFYLEKITSKLKNKIIVLSEKEYQIAKNVLRVPESKLAIIRHGIMPPIKYEKEKAREILRGQTGKKIDAKIWFGTVANLYLTKGIDILLNAVIADKQHLNDACFIIIGDGPEKNNLMKTIESNHLQNIVHLAGRIDDAAALMTAFDYFILPSRKEGYPYAILEAGAQKIPVIASNAGGIPEMIRDKKTGILFENEDARALSEAIIFAMNNPERMKGFAEDYFAKKNNNRDEMNGQTISLYSSLMNS